MYTDHMSFSESKIGRFMVGAGCVMEHAPTGKILCLLRDRANFQKGEWELMYGRIDQHEDVLTGLRREVGEEVGIVDFEVKKLLRVWHFYRGEEKAETEIHGFTFHCQTQSDQVTLSTEHAEYQWMEPEEALKHIKIEGIRLDVELFMQRKTTPGVGFSTTDDVLTHTIG